MEFRPVLFGIIVFLMLLSLWLRPAILFALSAVGGSISGRSSVWWALPTARSSSG